MKQIGVELDYRALTHEQILGSRLGSPSGVWTVAILGLVHEVVGLVCRWDIGHRSCSTEQAYRTPGPYRTGHAGPLLRVKRARSHPVPRRERCRVGS